MFSVFLLVSFRVWGSPSWPILKKQRPTLALEPSKKAALSARTWRGRQHRHDMHGEFQWKLAGEGLMIIDDILMIDDAWWLLICNHYGNMKMKMTKEQNHHPPRWQPPLQPSAWKKPPHSGTLARPLCPVLVSKRPQATSKVANHRHATLKRSEPGAVELQPTNGMHIWDKTTYPYLNHRFQYIYIVHFQGRMLLLPSFTGLEW